MYQHDSEQLTRVVQSLQQQKTEAGDEIISERG
jgi:hypothetical protein